MTTEKRPEPLNLRPLAPYEDRLLAALAFFRTQRQAATQAHHCLSMYLRQSETRILSEVGFYAERVGMSASELLELIYTQPDLADKLLSDREGISMTTVFEPDPE